MKRLLAILLSSLMLLCMGASAQDTSSQESRKARLEQEIALLDKQIRDTEAKSKDAMSILELTRRKISSRKELVRESDKEIASINRDITAKQKEINAIRAKLDTLTSHYNRLLTSAYKHRDARLWYMYILSSANVAQGLRRYSYFKNLSADLNRQGMRIKEVQAELELQREALQKLRAEAQKLRDQRVRETESLQAEEKEAQKQVNAIQKNRSKYQSELNAKKKQVDALNREIAKIIAEAMKTDTKKSNSKDAKPKEEIDYKLAGEFQANKGKLPWPADGPVLEHFGKQFNSVFKNLKMPDNQGVTIATAPGATVKAVYDGTVKSIIVMPGYNQCVLVQHGNYFTFYCKLGAVSVKSGDRVKTGDKIGTVDTISGQTQLHFEVWQGSKPQNPETWLRPR